MPDIPKTLPFPPQVDTSDLVIGVSLDDLVDGITAAATDLPATPVRTVVTMTQEEPADVVPIRSGRGGEPVDPSPTKGK